MRRLMDVQKVWLTKTAAQSLATPVRGCNITRARLPNHFLVPFASVVSAQEKKAELN